MNKSQPKVIGRIPITLTAYHEKLLRRSILGQVHESSFEKDDPIHVALCDLCNSQGYSPNNNSRGGFNPFGYIHGIGSIFPHDDFGMSLTACALVTIDKIADSLDDSGDFAFIQGPEVLTDIKIGNVFVFDADETHAWMVNCRWVMASQTIDIL
jgi:hypothetical protein